ncbi:MAG: hypothetical protein HY902_12860 [Deltaproteobacteria bacterium]|nr:hypothetical protein [Deltaproteobacteria bacterium]
MSQPFPVTLAPPEWSNRQFFDAYAAPGRVGLVGLASWIDRRIRRSQRRLDPARQWSLWSHAFLFEGRRLDGEHWLLESDLDLHSHFIRLGVQENRLDKYCAEDEAPTLAVLDFGLDTGQTEQVLAAALGLLGSLTRYSIPKVFATWLALQQGQLGRRFGRDDQRAVYCSAFVCQCYQAAGLDLAPGVLVDNALPELLWSAPLPHQAWLLDRATV